MVEGEDACIDADDEERKFIDRRVECTYTRCLLSLPGKKLFDTS